MRTETEVLARTLQVLAQEIESPDGVANAAIAEAAERLLELAVQVMVLKSKVNNAEEMREVRAEAALAAVAFGRKQDKYFLRDSEDILQQIEQYAESIRQGDAE